MSRNYYAEINRHLTWHCKDSAPMLNQRSHHTTGKSIDRLERITEVETINLGGNPVNGVDSAKEGGFSGIRVTRHKCRAEYRLKPETGVNARPSRPSPEQKMTPAEHVVSATSFDSCAGHGGTSSGAGHLRSGSASAGPPYNGGKP
jgi:hypothetical protein